VRPQQTVNDMTEEVLWRQSKAQARRTGQSLVEARLDVVKTPAGMQLAELGGGLHQYEKARYWQATTHKSIGDPYHPRRRHRSPRRDRLADAVWVRE
jgi:hypothetical protein